MWAAVWQYSHFTTACLGERERDNIYFKSSNLTECWLNPTRIRTTVPLTTRATIRSDIVVCLLQLTNRVVLDSGKAVGTGSESLERDRDFELVDAGSSFDWWTLERGLIEMVTARTVSVIKLGFRLGRRSRLLRLVLGLTFSYFLGLYLQ